MIVSYSYERKVGIPRPAETYRGARRNAARGSTWRGAVPTGAITHPPVRANVSRKHDPTWARARAWDPIRGIVRTMWQKVVGI
jgi:hypothetical protein